MRTRPKLLIIATILLLSFPLLGEAFSAGDEEKLFIERLYDKRGRREIDARLQRVTNDIYFYVDKEWWGDLEDERRREYDRKIYRLGNEFERHIYPNIVSRFGSEPEHEVTREDRIFVLFHPMRNDAGGYYRTGDQYSRFQYSRSNERNIVYLNTELMNDPLLPGFLGHEFMHLVTFAQKTEKHGTEEEIWLNELRAEYMPTFLGYDDDFQRSNLQQRAITFLRNPDISLTEWTEQTADYGVVNLFAQYLVDHYGVELLAESLDMSVAGIPSLDYALEKTGHDLHFSDVFTDWTIAVYLNDCSVGERYCYKNEHLRDLRVDPVNKSLSSKEERISMDYRTKNWAGNWYEIEADEGSLRLSFDALQGRRFAVPYVLCDTEEDCEVNFMELDDEGNGEIFVEDFGSEYNRIALIPSLQQKFSGFNGPEDSYLFRWEAVLEEGESVDLRERLREIRERVERLQDLLAEDAPFRTDLYFGMRNSSEVERLQRFLRDHEFYPEGLITGNFLEMTESAVIRFQERHAEEVLVPLGLSEGTGYVGSRTRSLMNSLMKD